MPCVKRSSYNLRKKLDLNLRLTLYVLKMLSLHGGVPWVFSAKDAFATLATDWSVVDCVSWLGAAGHCAFIASATACCTALEIEAVRACMLMAMRGCSVEASACC